MQKLKRGICLQQKIRSGKTRCLRWYWNSHRRRASSIMEKKICSSILASLLKRSHSCAQTCAAPLAEDHIKYVFYLSNRFKKNKLFESASVSPFVCLWQFKKAVSQISLLCGEDIRSRNHNFQNIHWGKWCEAAWTISLDFPNQFCRRMISLLK